MAEGKLSERELEKIREVIRGTGALDAAKEKSVEHARRAKELIQRTSMRRESKEFFGSFIDYIAQSLDWYK